MMRNIKLIISYDGTAYHGFQIQKGTGLKTIQEALEKALGVLTQETVTINGSGRTDAGVHAKGQVVNFSSNTRIPAERLPYAVNSLLPPDIVVIKADDVPDDFHARLGAKRKTYHYTFYNDRFMDPFWRYYAYHVPVKLNTSAKCTIFYFFYVFANLYRGYFFIVFKCIC
jgi:tRNA pseudouridine38-40 synthase